MKIIIRIILTIIISPILLATCVTAGTDNTNLHAHARVLPYVLYDLNHQEVNLTITQEDIDRGYKEISHATIISVKTNSLNGYMISFFILGEYINEVTLLDGSNYYSLSKAGREVHFISDATEYVTKEFSFRFALSDDATPGTYRWPVSFMISPV